MTVSNRNQHEPGRFRAHMTCPCCGSGCLIHSSAEQSIVSRMSYLRCVNPVCGWTGVAVYEIVRTITPPSRYYKPAPIPLLDGKYAEAVDQELNPAQQKPLL